MEWWSSFGKRMTLQCVVCSTCVILVARHVTVTGTPFFQDAELTAGTVVEFDVERDHHKKSGKNRLVARQVAVLHPALAPSFGYAVPHQVGMDAAYGMYGAQVAQSYQPPLYYQGASPMAEQYAFGQAPFSYDPYAQHGMMHLSHQPINHSLPTQFVTSPATAQAQRLGRRSARYAFCFCVHRLRSKAQHAHK